jgi:hypothetical protein
MNNKVRAAFDTAVMVLSVILASLGVTFLLEMFDPTEMQVKYILGGVLLTVFTYIVYTFNLNTIEFNENRKNIKNNK